MSLYLTFLLKRCGAPPPRRIVLLKHELDWANHQIEDEFRHLYADTEMLVTPDISLSPGDLLVLPHLRDFVTEFHTGPDLFRKLRNTTGVWVMVYGLEFRRVEVVPGRDLWRYYRRRKNLLLLRQVAPLRPVFRSLIKFWKRRCA